MKIQEIYDERWWNGKETQQNYKRQNILRTRKHIRYIHGEN